MIADYKRGAVKTKRSFDSACPNDPGRLTIGLRSTSAQPRVQCHLRGSVMPPSNSKTRRVILFTADIAHADRHIRRRRKCRAGDDAHFLRFCVLSAVASAQRAGAETRWMENFNCTRRRFTWPRELTRSTISCPV